MRGAFLLRNRLVEGSMLCGRLDLCGRVAQLVEQRPFKAWVLGSSPSALTSYPIEITPLIENPRVRYWILNSFTTFSWDRISSDTNDSERP